MSNASTARTSDTNLRKFGELLGHPKPLWMLCMAEFWERFAFYGIRWALVLYIVAQFHGADSAGEADANRTYGAYLALVYASALFGGYVADRILGYQHSILLGAAFMAAGFAAIAIPNPEIFKVGLATIIIGNGLFKPNISTLIGKLYQPGDPRRDFGFAIFYMGINAGGLVAPLLTGWLAISVFGTEKMPAYNLVFICAGIGMLISLVWFWIGRRQLLGIGAPPESARANLRVICVALGGLATIPIVYTQFSVGAEVLLGIFALLFLGLVACMLVGCSRDGTVHRDQVVAMLLFFTFNILFWTFNEQAGSSFNFLAARIVDREFGGFAFPTAWFQSVQPIATIVLAPTFGWLWLKLGRLNPSIAHKFSFSLMFNSLALLILIYALSNLVDLHNKIPFWTLFAVYVLQAAGEQCLSPVGLSMVTKLAPSRLAGLAMGGWFLSMGIGDNLSGVFAGMVSGKLGMTIQSAQVGYNFGFWVLFIAGLALFMLAPLLNRLTHGVK